MTGSKIHTQLLAINSLLQVESKEIFSHISRERFAKSVAKRLLEKIQNVSFQMLNVKRKDHVL